MFVYVIPYFIIPFINFITIFIITLKLNLVIKFRYLNNIPHIVENPKSPRIRCIMNISPLIL